RRSRAEGAGMRLCFGLYHDRARRHGRGPRARIDRRGCPARSSRAGPADPARRERSAAALRIAAARRRRRRAADPPRLGSGGDGRAPRPGLAAQEGQLDARLLRSVQVRRGFGHGLRGKLRGGAGRGAVRARAARPRRPAVHRRLVADSRRRRPGRARRHGSQRRVHAAAAALRKPESGIAFAGYVEGKDVFSGLFDVIATDGFTGNVLLKTAEGAVWAFGQLLKRQIQSSRVASAGALLIKSQLEQVKKRVDYEEVGGAPLLGVQGVAMIAHGRSTHRAILNALSGAEAFAQQHLEEDLTAAARRGEELFAQR